ncbi:nuclear pore complex protein NUP35-like [Gossypium australe]|uniref:Nuclear pore complex protein NUP35 n=1 Tax=Gossypium australe TaxID=47621 RepID=A0A5B6UU88_9ROSI|nr:nuclear pore complex protein NUP35-like [Gossypium australe]
MSTAVHRTPKSGRQSLFYQDLASPISARRGKFSSPGQAAAVSALWQENFGGSDLPPPPMYTLEDRSDFSPESGILDYPMSPEIKSDPKSPVQSSGRDFSTSAKSKSGASTSFAILNGQQNQQSPASLSWWSPAKNSSNEQDDKGKGSPVEGVVQPGALITLPPPREVARPEIQRNSVPAGNLDEEEWVTVYGYAPSYFLELTYDFNIRFLSRFSPADTNLVLREFEKCGVILKHVPGPRDANWMHILYLNRSDAQRALSKNGMQINGALIIGVKPVDPMQREALNERMNNQGFMTLPPPSSRTSELSNFRPSRPYYLQNGNTNARQSGSAAIANPTKSLGTKIMEYMFGY